MVLLWCGWGFVTPSVAQAPVSDSLNNALTQANSLEEETEAWLKLADYYETRNLDTTYYFIQQAMAAAKKASYDLGRADAYVRLASYFAHYQRYNDDSLHRYLEQGITIYQGEEDSSRVAQAYHRVSQTSFYSDYYPTALQYANTAKELYQLLNDRLALAQILSLLCEIQNRMGNNVIALNHCIESLNIYNELGIETQKAHLNKTIGIINLDVRSFVKAKEYLLQAVEFAERSQDTTTLSSAYIGIGKVNIETEDYDAALESFQRAISINQERETGQLAFAYYNIGKTYLLQGQPKQAIPLLEEALAMSENFKYRSLQAKALLELSKTYYSLGELDQCFSYLTQSLKQAPRNTLGSSEILRECYKELSKYYHRVGDLENAIVNYGLYDLERNRAFQAETAQRFAEMETVYESGKKDNQIEILQQENQIQSLLASERKLMNFFLIISLSVLFGLGILGYSKYQVKIRANRKLEEQKEAISQQKIKIEKQRDEITEKSLLLEENSRDIKDSIEYARRIQLSLLPEKDKLKHLFPDSFVFHRPKDIVSGDFYWAYETKDVILIAVLDCTGHGVPGAFMTVLANSVLDQVVQESKVASPNNMLSLMDTRIREALRQSEDEDTNTDGLDMAMCMINRHTLEVCYSGAQIPLHFTHQGELCKLEPSRYFIGGGRVKDKYFTNQCKQLQRGDMLYLTSDGFQDQFGGPKDKKFMRSRFRELLESIQDLPTAMQYQKIKETFLRWQGDQIQTDDVLLVGIRL
ncbi:MAG: tetratricopeptide repeat protein [Cyclobacteriaceae bacterium]